MTLDSALHTRALMVGARRALWLLLATVRSSDAHRVHLEPMNLMNETAFSQAIAM